MLVITHRPCSPQLAGSLFGHWVFYCQAWGSHHALAWWNFHTEAAVSRWWQHERTQIHQPRMSPC